MEENILVHDVFSNELLKYGTFIIDCNGIGDLHYSSIRLMHETLFKVF